MIDNSVAMHALNMSPVGVVIFDDEKKIQWVNQVMSDFLAVPVDQLTGMSSLELSTQYLDSFADHPDLWKVANVTSRQNRWLISLDTPDEGDTKQKICYYVDVSEIMKLKTEVRNLQDQLDNNSTSDTLTGLLNKRSLLQSLEPQVSRSRRYNNPLTLIVMQVTDFNTHDDSTKPSTDQALSAISFYLRDQMRWVDLVGRTGDSEFTLILPETNIGDATVLVDKINQRMSNLSLPEAPEVSISVEAEFGIAEWQKGDDTSILIRKAKNSLCRFSEISVA